MTNLLPVEFEAQVQQHVALVHGVEKHGAIDAQPSSSGSNQEQHGEVTEQQEPKVTGILGHPL